MNKKEEINMNCWRLPPKVFIFLFIALINLSFASATLNDAGAYYALDVNGTISDSSGNGNTGTIYGAIYTSQGKINGGYTLTTNQNISINGSNTIDNVGDFTYTFWANISDTNSGFWIQKGLYYVGKGGFVGINGGKYFFGITTAASTTCEDSSFNAVTGIQHIALVRRGSVLELWRNSTNIVNKTGCSVASLTEPTGKLYLGGLSAGVNSKTGMIDEVAFYNRSLSGTEIIASYNSGSGINPYPSIFLITNYPANNTYKNASGVNYNENITTSFNVTAISGNWSISFMDNGTSKGTFVVNATTGSFTLNPSVLTTGDHYWWFSATSAGVSSVNTSAQYLGIIGGTSTTTIYPSCFVFSPGCYAYTTLTSNNCAIVGR